MNERGIVFITRAFYGGRGNWDRELMEQLVKRGYNVHAITCPFPVQYKNEEKKLIDSGVKFHFINSWNYFLFFIISVFKLYKIASENIILYTPSSKPIPFYYILTKLMKIPIVFSLQGAEVKEIDTMPEFEGLRKHILQYKLKRKVVEFLEKTSAKLADSVIVISKAIEDELIHLGIPEKKINLIYYAIDTNIFKKNLKKRKEIREYYGIGSNDIVISYVARLSKSNAPTRMWSAEMLLKTFASISPSHPCVKIMFVGGGDGVKYLKNMCKDYGIEEHVIFVGFVPHEKVPEYLSASDIFWFVMGYPIPTYGLALQEAMSCENIVIANDSGAMREVIIDRYNGFLVEPKEDKMREKLMEILKMERGELENIKRAARKHAEDKYSWDVVLPRIMSIFYEVSKER